MAYASVPASKFLTFLPDGTGLSVDENKSFTLHVALDHVSLSQQQKAAKTLDKHLTTMPASVASLET